MLLNFAKRTIVVMCALLLVAGAMDAQSKEEKKIKIKTVEVKDGETTTKEQNLTLEEYEKMKKEGHFKDIDIQMHHGKEGTEKHEAKKEVRIEKKKEGESGEKTKVEIREMKDGKETIKILEGKEAEEYVKGQEKDSDSCCSTTEKEKEVKMEKKIIKKKSE